jgi:hypothetical protein
VWQQISKRSEAWSQNIGCATCATPVVLLVNCSYDNPFVENKLCKYGQMLSLHLVCNDIINLRISLWMVGSCDSWAATNRVLSPMCLVSVKPCLQIDLWQLFACFSFCLCLRSVSDCLDLCTENNLKPNWNNLSQPPVSFSSLVQFITTYLYSYEVRSIFWRNACC